MPNGVQFEEDDDFGQYKNSVRLSDNKETKGILGLLIKSGLAKNSTTATYILIGVTIIFFSVSVFIGFGLIGGNKQKVDPNVRIQFLQNHPSFNPNS